MAALHRIREWWRRDHRGIRTGEAGFTIVETTVAMTLVFVVLTGTLATFSASVRNLVTGQQRTGAVALARASVEEARSALYGQVGHNLAGDPTLAEDPALTGTPPVFEGEELVGVARPAFDPHRSTVTNDTGTFTRRIYISWVQQGTADPFKRITVVVSWDNGQYDPATVSNDVRLSSFMFEAGVPPDPLVNAVADADGGTVTVTGTLDGIDLSRAVIFNPSAGGDLSSLFIRESSGEARTSGGLLEVNSGPITGCEVTAKTAECPGLTAGSATDSDTSTLVAEHDAEGPSYAPSRSASAGEVLSLNLGGNESVESRSTSRSCFACFAKTIGDDDRLAYHWSKATGPDSASIGFDVGPVLGNLLAVTGASRVTATTDQDSVSDTHMVAANGRLQMPSVDVVTLQGAPAGFVSAVQIGSIDVQVDAAAGPTAPAPSVTGNPVELSVYDTIGGNLGYRTITITPGEQREESATAAFAVDDANVSLTTTVVSAGKATSKTTDADGTTTYAEASLTNWLRITVRVVVTTATGTLADTTIEFDYGRLAVRSQWEVG